jgi:hypothetical protein
MIEPPAGYVPEKALFPQRFFNSLLIHVAEKLRTTVPAGALAGSANPLLIARPGDPNAVPRRNDEAVNVGSLAIQTDPHGPDVLYSRVETHDRAPVVSVSCRSRSVRSRRRRRMTASCHRQKPMAAPKNNNACSDLKVL